MKRVMILAALAGATACNSGTAPGSTLPPVTMISPDSANQQSARFSPDGTRLFWWEPSGVGFQLWTAGADMSGPTKVPVTTLQNLLTLWSPDGKQIAVTSSDAGLMEVAVIPAGGGVPKQVTKSSGLAVPQGWNRDGDRITYVASAAGSGGGTFQSFVVSLSHGGNAPLVPGEKRGYGGLWSPDGSHIGYVVFDSGRSTIWVADSDGRHPRQLTHDGFEQAGNSEWIFSPDSKWIAYESRRTGTSDIWIVPVDSGAPKQLTRDVRNDSWPVWSLDGKWIAFLSDRGRQSDIWVVPAAGGPELRVTDDAAVEDLMQWLPGNRFAYLTGIGASGIWAMSLADGSEHRLTPDSIRTGPPQLSPDGKSIAFRIDRGGGISDIAVMPTAGGAMRILVQGGANTNIVWSPDGTQIAYVSDRGGTPDIWMVAVADGKTRQIESWPGTESGPRWSGDGSWLYFISDHDARITDAWKVSPAGGEPVRVTRNGTVNNITMRRGRPEIYGSAVNTAGTFEVVQIKADGSLRSIWTRENSFPIDITPAGDSLVIGAGQKTGGFAYQMIPATGAGEGRPLLKNGEGFNYLSDDGNQILYTIPSGATYDLGLLHRADGTTRQLTKTSADEGGGVLTPDGKTVLFQRSRTVRRIAIADLSKLLAAGSH